MSSRACCIEGLAALHSISREVYKMAAQMFCVADEIEEAHEVGIVDQFSSITGVGRNLATFYLKLGDWNIESALDRYYEAVGSTQSVLAQCSGTGDSSSPLLIPDDEYTVVGTTAAKHSPEEESGKTSCIHVPPLKLLSWNIDGLDERNILERTRAVGDIINARQPDVVFLQEVTHDSLPVLQSKCSSYKFQTGNVRQGYFNTMLLHKETVKPTDSLQCLSFHSSSMGRHLLVQPASFNDIAIVLMTSHLESTGRCATERKHQFQQVLEKMQDQSSGANVIFGGDTNLRDEEVSSVGGLPPGIVDLWQACGSPANAQYSWNVRLNDNLDWQTKYKPRLRFDRLFLRPAQQSRCLTPNHITFVGTDRLPGCQRFPSDHWGLWVELL